MNTIKQLFTCKRDGLLIRGVQYLPENFQNDKKYPAIIISHGFTSNYSDVGAFGEAFALEGYVAFCFSFCGGSSMDAPMEYLSEGATTDMTVWTEVDDLLTVKDYVKSLEFVDKEKIVLMGFSQGGFVSGLAAARCGAEISKLIMVHPAICIPDHARRGCLGGANYNPQEVPEILDCGRILLGKKFHDTVVEVDPYLELSAYEGDVLILHGLVDSVVDYSYSIRARDSYAKGQCHLQLIRDMDHGFNEEQMIALVESAKQFLAEREEILTIRVLITHCESTNVEDIQKNDIYFTGYCETPFFQGAITPEGCDKQEYRNGELIKIRAEYSLLGHDATGQTCTIHIINQRCGNEWKPIIKTDSEALEWLNHADLTAVLELVKGGPVVRIFAKN